MQPDSLRAATLAMETLIKHRVSYAPVSPLPILKSTPGVLVRTYADMAAAMGVERSCVLNNLSAEHLDATTAVDVYPDGRLRYLIGYNRLMPSHIAHRALARELGHIVLGHDGSRPEDVREAEAVIFSRYLLCPRPLLRAVRAAGIPLTEDLLASITAVRPEGLRSTPGLPVPPELNRLVRDQFAAYVDNLATCREYLPADTDGPVCLGTYMDNYQE